MAMRSRRDQEDGLAGTFRFRERARERSIPGDAGLTTACLTTACSPATFPFSCAKEFTDSPRKKPTLKIRKKRLIAQLH